jgi:hypothetical protein
VAVAVVVLVIGEAAGDPDMTAGSEVGGDRAGKVASGLDVDPNSGTAIDGESERCHDAAVGLATGRVVNEVAGQVDAVHRVLEAIRAEIGRSGSQVPPGSRGTRSRLSLLMSGIRRPETSRRP